MHNKQKLCISLQHLAMFDWRMAIIANLAHTRPIIFLFAVFIKIWAQSGIFWRKNKINEKAGSQQHMIIIRILIIRIRRTNYKIQIENYFICHPSRCSSKHTLQNNDPHQMEQAQLHSDSCYSNISFMHNPLMNSSSFVVVATTTAIIFYGL